jgi:hypothetical protein
MPINYKTFSFFFKAERELRVKKELYIYVYCVYALVGWSNFRFRPEFLQKAKMYRHMYFCIVHVRLPI